MSKFQKGDEVDILNRKHLRGKGADSAKKIVTNVFFSNESGYWVTIEYRTLNNKLKRFTLHEHEIILIDSETSVSIHNWLK